MGFIYGYSTEIQRDPVTLQVIKEIEWETEAEYDDPVDPLNPTDEEKEKKIKKVKVKKLKETDYPITPSP